MKILSEQKLRDEIEEFIDNAIDEDLIIFYNRFGMSFSEEEFYELSDEDKEFIRDDLLGILDVSFETEMITVIKFYQIMHCLSYHGVTNHNPPRFKFEELSPAACQVFLISEGIINEPI
jgi:hypothetical protein